MLPCSAIPITDVATYFKYTVKMRPGGRYNKSGLLNFFWRVIGITNPGDKQKLNKKISNIRQMLHGKL
ncbi:hypothetical protein, partial [Atlantibacter hermannii]|uniref:hypothetical protein n=1 Tax=Atlantibacter hermannii TaxID=565 RepID=UPI003017CF10